MKGIYLQGLDCAYKNHPNYQTHVRFFFLFSDHATFLQFSESFLHDTKVKVYKSYGELPLLVQQNREPISINVSSVVEF